jgi:flagellar biosynthesis anti-sigma factor FlgM
MRVDLTTSGAEPPENTKTARAGQAGGAQVGTGRTSNSTSSSTSGLDPTRFSFDRSRVQSLEAQVLAQPEVRAAKVQALRQAIGQGDYSVPPSQVADALVGDLAG